MPLAAAPPFHPASSPACPACPVHAPQASSPTCAASPACPSCPACPACNIAAVTCKCDCGGERVVRVAGSSDLIAPLFLAGALPGEHFGIELVAIGEAHVSEKQLCKGKKCYGQRFFMVHQKRSSSDNILHYLLEKETPLIGLFLTILSSEDCSHIGKRVPSCRLLSEEPPLVFDVGSNHGFYGLLSLASGSEVVFIDPQPHCIQYVRAGVVMSGFSRSATIVNAFADDSSSLSYATCPIRSGCWGTYPLLDWQADRTREEYDALPGGNANARLHADSQPPPTRPTRSLGPLLPNSYAYRQVTVSSVLLSKLVREAVEAREAKGLSGHILVMKIDAEGHETRIIESLAEHGVLRDKLVRNFVVEFNKAALSRNLGKSKCAKEPVECFARLFQLLLDAGYTLLTSNKGNFYQQEPIVDAQAFASEGWVAVDVWAYLPQP